MDFLFASQGGLIVALTCLVSKTGEAASAGIACSMDDWCQYLVLFELVAVGPHYLIYPASLGIACKGAICIAGLRERNTLHYTCRKEGWDIITVTWYKRSSRSNLSTSARSQVELLHGIQYIIINFLR